MLFKRPGGISWLVVFLGNPGTKYEMTRHNAGFMAGDAMAKAQGAAINRSRFKALTGTCDIGGEHRHAHEAADIYESVRRGGGSGSELL